MPSRTVLVLGASGFLGPHLVGAARGRGWRVVAASRQPGEFPRAPWRPDSSHACDLLDTGALERVLAAERPAAVILAAALARVEECEREPAQARVLNADVPEALARHARRLGLRFVLLSTDLVFGGRPPRHERYAEDDEPSPVHAYGASKAEGEARVLAAHAGALVVRLPLLYGDSFGRGLGASDQVLAALAGGERPTLFDDEWRTPLEAGNAAAAVLELLEGDACGLLHVAGPRRLNRYELAQAVLVARGAAERIPQLRAAPRSRLGLEALRPADASLDSARALALLATPLLAPGAALRAAHERVVP